MHVSPRQDPAELRQLLSADADPSVRRRAGAVLLVTGGQPISQVARLFHTTPDEVRIWCIRFLMAGRAGLADEPRPGRPPKLQPADLALLIEALERGPQAYGRPRTDWTIRDLQQLLWQQRRVQACGTTIRRALRRLGYRYCRPPRNS